MEEGKEMTREGIWVPAFILIRFDGIIMAYFNFHFHFALEFSSATELSHT